MQHRTRFSTSLLWLLLAMVPSFAHAQDVLIGGNKTQAGIPIPAGGGGWTTLLTTPIALPDAVYSCEVTCTSTWDNPQSPAADQDYYYAAFNTANPNLNDACVRPFDFKQAVAGVDEIEDLVVATTCYRPGLQGQQIFRCLGQSAAGQVATVVDNTSMHVICVEN